jgi:hypothetical protein
MNAFGLLQEKMSTWEYKREAKRREHAQQHEESNKKREADLQQLRQEFLSMLQEANGQAKFHRYWSS